MFYTFEVLRNESKEIIGRRCLGKSVQPQHFRGKECEVVQSTLDLDTDMVRYTTEEKDWGDEPAVELDPDKEVIAASEADIAMRIRRIQFGQRLIAIMGIRNDAKELSVEQILQLVADFADINNAWLNGMIASSRGLIDAITPDGTLLTTADKTAILAEIDSNWSALGYV
jgi:hypothetical protein